MIIILKNQTDIDVKIIDLGEFVIPASGQETLTDYFSLNTIVVSVSIKDLINDDKLLVNDGVQDLNKQESLSILSLKTGLEVYNPSEFIYMMQANILSNLFYNHTEEMMLSEELKNCFVDFLKSLSDIESITDLSYIDSSLILEKIGGTEVQIDSLDSISSWDSDEDTSITLEETIIHEGDGSLKFTIASSLPTIFFYETYKTYSIPVNWTDYDEIRIWVYGQGTGEEFKFMLYDELGAGSIFETFPVKLAAGWQEVTSNIALANRTQISNIKLSVKKPSMDEIVVYFDDLRIYNSENSTFKSSGTAFTTNLNVITDISHIFFKPFLSTTKCSNFIIEISLDGGSNYHQIICEEIKTWVDVSTWDEYSSFENLQNIKLKIQLLTDDNTQTPVFDDYFIMWKYDL